MRKIELMVYYTAGFEPVNYISLCKFLIRYKGKYSVIHRNPSFSFVFVQMNYFVLKQSCKKEYFTQIFIPLFLHVVVITV
jgi:hypothetical protein